MCLLRQQAHITGCNVHIVSLNLNFSRAFCQQLQPAVNECGRLASPAREDFATVAWKVCVRSANSNVRTDERTTVDFPLL
jgi:hypothetical protein